MMVSKWSSRASGTEVDQTEEAIFEVLRFCKFQVNLHKRPQPLGIDGSLGGRSREAQMAMSVTIGYTAWVCKGRLG